jgi:hypothetical protein
MPVEIHHMCARNLANIPNLLKKYESREMTIMDKPWDLFHGLLGRLRDYEIRTEDGQKRSCTDWLLRAASWEGYFGRVPLIVSTKYGYLFTHGPTPSIKMEYEDHQAQFLYILQECGYDFDERTFCAPPKGTEHSLRDIFQAALKYTHGLSDVSWLLPVALKWSQNPEWVNKFGRRMDLEDLFLQHLERQEHCTTCFATHWHTALVLSLEYGGKKVSRALRVRAKEALRDAIEAARSTQEQSGQFNLEWREYVPKQSAIGNEPCSPGESHEPFEEVSHQGHMLEWLIPALAEEELITQKWAHRAVGWLVTELGDTNEEIPYGIHSHCAHALRLYERRINKVHQGITTYEEVLRATKGTVLTD